MEQLIAFGALTIALICISWGSLRSPRSHGFYRFFAWEFIAALFLFNIDVWFQNPWSWYQLFSCFLLIVCIVPLVFGIRTLIDQGKPEKQPAGKPRLLGFEKTSVLVTTGIYHYIRHPLYIDIHYTSEDIRQIFSNCLIDLRHTI